MTDGKHAFFNMYKYPQVGDRIRDLDLRSRPLATIIRIEVLSSGHAMVTVEYDDPSIASTGFNFCNHKSTWELLYPNEIAA
jgi:hypothetical protein